tara:strand:+ start:8168 stop:10192 length:2025 start_codon:yes stop_codon:yes gene_type:complete
MEQFYRPSLFLGLFRLGMFVLFVAILYRFAVPKSGKTKTSNYAGLIFFISAAVLLCFVLIQINSFDRFTVFLVIFGFIVLTALDLRWGIPLKTQLKERRENTLLFFLDLTDRNASFSEWLKTTFFKKSKIQRTVKKLFRKKALIHYGIPIAVFITAYLSRVWFLHFDNYTLSNIWYNDLIIVKGLGNQNWLSNREIILGDYALISLYKQLTGISSSLALQTFGFLESSLLAVSVFWGTSKITQTRWFPGLIAALGFIFLYGFMLLDIATITQHRSVFLALAIAIPAFAMVLRPETLSKNKRAYFLKMTVLFSGIAFIDLFVSLLVAPLFLLFAYFSIPKGVKPFFKSALLAFMCSLLLVLCIYAMAVFSGGDSFSEFLYSNLYSVSSYTYVPQLVLPYSEFVVFLQIVAISGLVLVLPLFFRNKKKGYTLLAFSLLLVSLTQIMNIKNLFFDRDVLNQLITVFIPISFGILIWVVFCWLQILLGQKKRAPLAATLSMVVLVLGSLGLWQQQNPLQLTKRSLAIESVLSAYNTIESNYLPYSYAIVNSVSSAPISRDSHYFINYEYFNTRYLDRDANYAKHRTDKALLKENPHLILPKTTFVFLYSEDAQLNIKNGINAEDQKRVRENLSVLRQREREVRLFYKGKEVEVYEIINEPGAGNINDLLSKNNSREAL